MERRNVSPPAAFGALLRELRAAANITQEELAERSGVSLAAVAALEQGIRRSPRPSTVEWLAEALKLNAQQKEAFVAAARGSSTRGPARLNGRPDGHTDHADAGTLIASMPTDVLPDRAPLPPGSRMPLAPNPLFVGRGEELLQVAGAFHGGGTTVALGQVVASTGLGGLGKTQLAVELVHRYGRFFTGGVFWLSFASADEVPLQVAACAGPGFAARSQDERLAIVQNVWQSAVPRLLVFDNCEDEALLEAWRPSTGGCRVLVTSRRSHWSPTLGVTALPLDLLPRVDSIELLRRYRPDLAPGDPGLDAIANELGDLPLALHLAGSYLRTYHAEVSLDGYVAELRRFEIVQHASLLGAGLDDSLSPTHHVQGLAQTFALCLGRLDREHAVDRLAIALLARMAFMAPGEPVPRGLLAKTMRDVDPLMRADGLRRLDAVGLVEEGEDWLRMHRLLVHFVRREGLDSDALPAVVYALIEAGEDVRERRLTGSALAALIPHLVDVAGTAGVSTSDERLVAELYSMAGRALQYAGDFRAAEPWYERALAIRERAVGPEHPDTPTSLNDLATLLYDQGKLAAAVPLFERALDVRERVLGPDHPDTALSLNNLALLFKAKGDLDAAKTLLTRALDSHERALGPEHRYTAVVLNNLSAVLRAKGELTAARPLAERSLDIRERVLGADHPDTALSLIGLGLLLYAQTDLNASRPLLDRALNIQERVLGPDHPATASTVNNLARLHRDQGDPAAARPLFERALAIRERVLGPDHPDTVATRRALEELAAEGDGAGPDA